MTLYMENAVTFPESSSISINAVWHPNVSLLAAASFSQDKGGYVIIFDELGEPIKDVNSPVHRSYQVTALTWHPERTILVSGWENGDLKVWNGVDKDFVNVVGPHKSPVTILDFSEKGGRLVSCDSVGTVVGWKIDGKAEAIMLFHLDLSKEQSITHLTFRLTPKKDSDFDVEGLAKAAVNGDESALDLFSNWRPKTTARKFRFQDGSDNLCFFIATQQGSVYYVNSSGSCSEVLNTEGTPLSYMVFQPNKDALVIMMEGVTLGYFSVDRQGHLSEIAKVKLSGWIQSRSTNSQVLTWAGTSSLAILTGDLTVRIWDLETNDNYVLPTTMKMYVNDDKSPSVSETFTCIAHCKLNQTLCAGTNIGRIYFWNRAKQPLTENVDDQWELNNINTIGGTIKQLKWGSFLMRQPLLSVNCVTAIYIMKEQTVCSAFCNKIWATQKTSNQIWIESSHSNQLLELESQVSDIAISEDFIVFSNGRLISLYNISWKADPTDDSCCEFSVSFGSSFNCDNDGIILYRKTIITLSALKITLFTHNWNIISHIPSVTSEGEPIGADITNNYLTIITMEGFLKIYDVSDDQPRLVTPVKNLGDAIADFGEVIQAKTNCKGNKVAFTLAASNLIPDGKLYILDVECDDITTYDFRKYDGIDLMAYDPLFEQEVSHTIRGDGNEEIKSAAVFDEICRSRIPIALFWCEEDGRLLICNARKIKNPGTYKCPVNNSSESHLVDEDQVIVTMFITSTNKIKIHDIRPVEMDVQLLALSLPYIVTLQKLNIVRDIMSDFVGLEECSRSTKEAVIDFSYHLSIGNMDAAFKSIKLVQSQGVWASLAKMCVKTRRLDVAIVCLGHMGNAKAARALREALADDSLPQEAKLAVLAIHLGLIEETEKLYTQCGRFDLLNKVLRCRKKMQEAHNLAETKNRINLKNTEHAWARQLERDGEFKEAAVRYEKAGTHQYDIPRMLSDHPQQLRLYMTKTKDKEMLKWWGQYVESQGDMNAALKIYANAGDVYSQVRVLCFLGEETKAADLAKTSSDKAALYHMARYFETAGHIQEAVNFYTKATAYSNAVRLAKENNLTTELWNLGMTVSNREKIEIANYFEEQDNLENAAVLYYRGGMLHKALNLAFKTQQFEVLQEIATQLDAESDPALINKCVQYFISKEQFDRAVDLLAIAKKYEAAIQVCMKHNVRLTEDLAEKLTPEKGSVDEAVRTETLQVLAESLMLQGDYHLATKKFTQSGDKVKAMKALLKSGDTDKIIFFAGISRQKEIYTMAANYLQTLDWQNQPEILRNIITFYSKGKAQDLLANFYVACAQVEIDEFQNYEKALGALSEASRCLQKITNPTGSQQIQKAMDIVQHRYSLVKKFMDIKKLFEREDPQAGMTQCKQLLMLNGHDLDVAVRRGDIYGLMIQDCVKRENFTEGKQLLMELRQILVTDGLKIPLTYYVGKDVIEALAAGLNMPVGSFIPPTVVRTVSGADSNDEDVIDEILEK
ncbi:intraflagellar transport protein 140 homolog isoform X1 [Euwallacea fornicatus]|uniref:intraflagellar transport protein 140 homolog isoform X1 n=1 Tax=Euwallacea fornicatus TaxID=995702 RepID=UPI00338D4733